MQINVIIDSEKINYSSATVYLVLLLDSLNLSFYSGDSYLSSSLLWNDFAKIYLYESIFFPFLIDSWNKKAPNKIKNGSISQLRLLNALGFFYCDWSLFPRICVLQTDFFNRSKFKCSFQTSQTQETGRRAALPQLLSALAFRTQSPSTCQRHHSDWLPWQMCRYNR